MASSEESTTLGSTGIVWEPLSFVDFVFVGFVASLQTLALGICAHLLWCRRWPPYVTKTANLVVISTFSGVLWTFTMAIASGYFRRRTGDLLACCDFERFLSWSTLCVHIVSFLTRVYRIWRILIKHDVNMWKTGHQIMFISSVSLIPVVSTWVIPSTNVFDEVANTCHTTTTSSYITISMNVLGFLIVCFIWFVCARQLKSVRRQFNEYNSLKRTLLLITLTLISYPIVVIFLLQDDLLIQRRVAILCENDSEGRMVKMKSSARSLDGFGIDDVLFVGRVQGIEKFPTYKHIPLDCRGLLFLVRAFRLPADPLITTHIILWGTIQEPFIMKLLGNRDYLLTFTKGFAEMPSPAQLKASLQEQLSVEQLRIEFRRYTKSKVAQELVDFYINSLDREEVQDFFERQARTMSIVEQYIKQDAPEQVNISEDCREKVLRTDVTAYDIFDDARAEVLAVMETNFRRGFALTEGFRRIVSASEEEQREIHLLRTEGMLLPRSPSDTPPGSPASSFREMGEKLPSPRLTQKLVATFTKLQPFVNDVLTASSLRRTKGNRGGASIARHISGALEGSFDANRTYLENPMATFAYAASITQPSSACMTLTTLTPVLDSDSTRCSGKDSLISMVKASETSNTDVANSRNHSTRSDNDIVFGGESDEYGSMDGVPVTTLMPRPPHSVDDTNLCLSSSSEGSVLEAANRGFRQSKMSKQYSSDTTSGDSLCGLKIATKVNYHKRTSDDGSSAPEWSFGVNKSGDLVKLATTQSPLPRGNDLSSVSNESISRTHAEVSSRTIAAIERVPDQVRPGPNYSEMFPGKLNTASCSQTETQEDSYRADKTENSKAAALPPPGLERLKNYTEPRNIN